MMIPEQHLWIAVLHMAMKEALDSFKERFLAEKKRNTKIKLTSSELYIENKTVNYEIVCSFAAINPEYFFNIYMKEKNKLSVELETEWQKQLNNKE